MNGWDIWEYHTTYLWIQSSRLFTGFIKSLFFSQFTINYIAVKVIGNGNNEIVKHDKVIVFSWII